VDPITYFYILGAAAAVWALVVAFLGITRHGFPASLGGERVVTALSVLFVLGALTSAIVGGALEEEEEGPGGGPGEESEPLVR
jgi:hypothetical protein